MPNNIIKSFVDKTGKSEAEIEKAWDKAVEISKEDKGEEDYAYITGIVKNMIGINESQELYINYLKSDKSIKEFIEKVVNEDGPQPSTSFNVNPQGGGIIPPNDKKDKEFEKNLNEAIDGNVDPAIDSNIKARNEVGDIVDKGSNTDEPVIDNKINMSEKNIKEETLHNYAFKDIDGKDYNLYIETPLNFKLPLINQLGGRNSFIYATTTNNDKLIQLKLEVIDFSSFVDKGLIEESISLKEKVSDMLTAAYVMYKCANALLQVPGQVSLADKALEAADFITSKN